jgi:hypothetical protein
MKFGVKIPGEWILRRKFDLSDMKIAGRRPSLLVWRGMMYLRISCLAILVISFAACSVTEQTPEDVTQKFKEGIKGNGQIVPEDKDRSQTSPSANSPVTKPAAAPAGIPESSPESQ